jgi:hypothetical protein
MSMSDSQSRVCCFLSIFVFVFSSFSTIKESPSKWVPSLAFGRGVRAFHLLIELPDLRAASFLPRSSQQAT